MSVWELSGNHANKEALQSDSDIFFFYASSTQRKKEQACVKSGQLKLLHGTAFTSLKQGNIPHSQKQAEEPALFVPLNGCAAAGRPLLCVEILWCLPLLLPSPDTNELG
ncbi:hypothetical protein XENORESO_018742 [Xenotaenia resolanae]|uniref:Uncharacterized protein n=1 Tax=Xenotaenia resolanae TaxID=208358 RepID=A0ABV0VNZ1_9TELE